ADGFECIEERRQAGHQQPVLLARHPQDFLDKLHKADHFGVRPHVFWAVEEPGDKDARYCRVGTVTGPGAAKGLDVAAVNVEKGLEVERRQKTELLHRLVAHRKTHRVIWRRLLVAVRVAEY